MTIRFDSSLLQGGQHLMRPVSEKAEIDRLVARGETLPDLVGQGLLIRHAFTESKGISKESHTGQELRAFTARR
jgi:hypothetical protein